MTAIDWAALIDAEVHPAKIAIVEAFDWIGEPFSASQLVAMGGPSVGMNAASYHMRALAKNGLLRPVEVRPVRGASEVIYAPA
jgi:hypothetical protein